MIEPTGYYHFVVVRALGGEPSVVKTLVAGPYKAHHGQARKSGQKSGKAAKAAKTTNSTGQRCHRRWVNGQARKSGQRPQKMGKNGISNQCDWSMMPPKMG